MDSLEFLRFLDIHQWIYAQHAAGITHEESCRAPAGGGNCLNWVLGHIAASREDMLKLLGAEPLRSEAEAAPYARGSAGEIAAASARPLGEILDALARSAAALKSRLEAMGPEQFARPAGKGTLGENLAFLQFHESYHAGQVGLLRRTLGKPGVIR